MTVSPHRDVNPSSMLPPRGFSHATVAGSGRTVYVGGQTGHTPDGGIADDLVEQFDRACANVVEVLRASGAAPEHLAWVQIFTTDVEEYRASLGPIGEAYRRHLGGRYPATALVEVSGLFDAGAKVELAAIAVVPA